MRYVAAWCAAVVCSSIFVGIVFTVGALVSQISSDQDLGHLGLRDLNFVAAVCLVASAFAAVGTTFVLVPATIALNTLSDPPRWALPVIGAIGGFVLALWAFRPAPGFGQPIEGLFFYVLGGLAGLVAALVWKAIITFRKTFDA